MFVVAFTVDLLDDNGPASRVGTLPREMRLGNDLEINFTSGPLYI